MKDIIVDTVEMPYSSSNILMKTAGWNLRSFVLLAFHIMSS